MIYQYVLTRPLFALLTCIVYYSGVQQKHGIFNGDYIGLTLTVGVLLCLMIAMWGLMQVYRIFSLILKPNNIGSKFLAIKCYIFIHAVQGFVFAALESRVDEDKTLMVVRVEYTLVCLEMFLGALLNKYVFFHYNEYIDHENEDLMEKIRLESRTYGNTSNDPLDPEQ